MTSWSADQPTTHTASGRLAPLAYLLVHLVPLLVIASVWLGPVSGHPDLLPWIPLLLAYSVVPLAQWLRPRGLGAPSASVLASPAWQAYHRVLPLGALPLQLAMLSVAGECWSSGRLGAWGALGLLVTTGFFSGIYAINVAHELMHRRERLDRLVAGLLLSTVSFGTFKVVHMQIHHPFVGTPLDFATARRGESVYRFWWRSLGGNFVGAVRSEAARLVKLGKPWWHSELVPWTVVSVLWLLLALALWGWWGGVFFLVQSILAILKLDSINYLQHYGLTRTIDANGRIEPIDVQHSWSHALFLDDVFLIGLMRHADHHAHPQRPYPMLRNPDAAPHYPFSAGMMDMISLVPPLFRAIAHPRLDAVARARAGHAA